MFRRDSNRHDDNRRNIESSRRVKDFIRLTASLNDISNYTGQIPIPDIIAHNLELKSHKDMRDQIEELLKMGDDRKMMFDWEQMEEDKKVVEYFTPQIRNWKEKQLEKIVNKGIKKYDDKNTKSEDYNKYMYNARKKYYIAYIKLVLDEVEKRIAKCIEPKPRKDRIRVYGDYAGKFMRQIQPFIEKFKLLESSQAGAFSHQYEEIEGNIKSALKEALEGKDSLFHRYNTFSPAYHKKRETGEQHLVDGIIALGDLYKTLVNEYQQPWVREKIKSHFDSGYQHWQNRQYEKARDTFSQVLELDGKHIRARELRGRAHLALGANEEALKDLEQVTKSDLASATAFFSCGVAYQWCKKNREALECYNQAIERDDTNAAAFTYRGLAYLEMGQFELAETDFTQVLKWDKDNVFALARRGAAYLEMGQFELAKA